MVKDKKTTAKYLHKLAKIEIQKKFLEWSKQVKERDQNKCVICGQINYVQAHHILPRVIHKFRFDIDNGVSLCVKHHKYSYEISPHKNPFEFILWLQKNRTEQFHALQAKNSNI